MPRDLMIFAPADSASRIRSGWRPTTSMRPRKTTGLNCSRSCSRYAQLDSCLRAPGREPRSGGGYGGASA